jgi:hypothetical protein
MVDRTSQTCPSSFKGKDPEEAIPGAREDQFTLRDSLLYPLRGTNVHLKEAHENRAIFTSLAVQSRPEMPSVTSGGQFHAVEQSGWPRRARRHPASSVHDGRGLSLCPRQS